MLTMPGEAAGGKGLWGFNLQHKENLTIFYPVTCLPLKWKGEVLQRERFWGAKRGKTLPDKTSRAGGSHGPGKQRGEQGPGKPWLKRIQELGALVLGIWDLG